MSLIDEDTHKEENYTRKLELFTRFVYPKDREQFIKNTRREKIFESFDANRTHIVDFRLQKSEEEHLYYQMRFVPLKDDDGKIEGFIACLRNIDSEIRKEFGIRKELENAKIAAESANRQKPHSFSTCHMISEHL